MYRIGALTFFLLVAVPTVAQDGEATFEGLGDLPGGNAYSQALAVSDDGSVVVGISSSADGNQAFRWADGIMEGLGDLPGGDFQSQASGVSADGSVVTGYSNSENGNEAFRWENGEMGGLGDLPGGDFTSYAHDVSADGSVVVGESSVGDGQWEAYRWENGEMEGLGDLDGKPPFNSIAFGISADGSVIVGESAAGRDAEAFRWEDGTMVGLGDIPGGLLASRAYDVSNDGSVIIGVGGGDRGWEAFRWTAATDSMQGLGYLSDSTFSSEARGMTADGAWIVGPSDVGQIDWRAYFWTEDDGMRNLKDMLEEEYGLDLTGWTLQWAMDMSDDGTVIVGRGINPDGNQEGWRVSGLYPVADDATPDALADALSAPNPNPVSRRSTFTIEVEHGQTISVEVFDTLGRHVQTLYEGALAAGESERLELDASALPAGVYVIRATGEDFTETQQVTIVR